MSFAEELLNWFDGNKRDLPWRHTKDPYRIWLSEIMLQQTRVETVKEYYRRFLSLFPDVQALASAPEEAVLKAWEGLGYYSRARNLQKAARFICENHQNVFPCKYAEILALPGIGPYTAGAVASIAFGEAVPAIDGNVYRVASRVFGIREEITSPGAKAAVDSRVRENQPADRAGDYNQALMELGATLCKPGTPDCAVCPVHAFCDAFAAGDAELLPVHEKKSPPRRVDLAVCLLEWQGKLLAAPRKETLLKGLYVFPLIEDETVPGPVQQLLKEEGLDADFAENLGHARHVFTHRIWEMEILHFFLREAPDEDWMEKRSMILADRAALRSLPFPTAMKKARSEAEKLLSNRE